MASVSHKIGLGNVREWAKAAYRESGSKHAVAEINAYIAIRDSLLVEVEEFTTRVRLDRVRVANEFVDICLRPAQSPYEAQCLVETDAARERDRCAAVKVRIVELCRGII